VINQLIEIIFQSNHDLDDLTTFDLIVIRNIDVRLNEIDRFKSLLFCCLDGWSWSEFDIPLLQIEEEEVVRHFDSIPTSKPLSEVLSRSEIHSVRDCRRGPEGYSRVPELRFLRRYTVEYEF